MQQTVLHRVFRAALLLAPGLYAGRVLSEALRPGVAGAVLLSLLCTFAGAVVLRRAFSKRILWPAVPLLYYVLYPAFHPGVALAAVGAALVALVLVTGAGRGEPLWRPSTTVLAVGIFLAAFALYASTLAPGVLPADNGELQVVAAQLGVAHPPGFALYTVVAHLFTRLPIGATAAYRANLFSAVLAATTLALVFLSALRLTRSRASGLLAALALASATTFWAQATTANIRMPTAFFAALAIYLLLRIRDELAQPNTAGELHGANASTTGPAPARSEHFRASRGAEAPTTSQPAVRSEHFSAREGGKAPSTSLFLFALTLSLGVTHHASLVFIGLVLGLTLVWLDPGLLRKPSRWAWPAAGFLMGLLPLLYFPLRASAAVRGASPELATLSGFLQHILALGFRGDLFALAGPQELWPRLQVMGNVMTFQFHWLLLAGMLLGFLMLLRAQPRMALALGGAFALHTLVTATYRAPQTVEYMLPAYVLAVLLLAAGAGIPLRVTFSSERPPTSWPRALPALLLATFLVAALAQGQQNYPSFEKLSKDRTARDHASTIMQLAPPGSVVLADWHWATPLWYMQNIEGQRADLDIRYVFPTAEPYDQTWVRRISENLARDRPVVSTHFDVEAYASLPPAEPLGDAFLFRQQPRQELPAAFTDNQETLGDQIELLGYRLGAAPAAPLEEAALTVAWRPFSGADAVDVTWFAHLVSAADGAIYAQQDVPVRPTPAGITLTQLRLTPRLAAQPGDYILYVGAYESASGRPLPASNGAARLPLETVSLQAMTYAPHTAHPQHAPAVRGEQQLVGYDWDLTLAPQTRLYLHWRTPEGYVTEAIDDPSPDQRLPSVYGPWGVVRQQRALEPMERQYYVPLGNGIVWRGAPQLAGETPAPGQDVTLTQLFVASRPLQQDLVVSARLIGYEPDGVHWDWWDLHDAVPALGAIPTLKWIEGSRVRDPHILTVSPEAPPGQTLGGLVTLYDAFTQRPLPILDERITERHLGIPLGAGHVP